MRRFFFHFYDGQRMFRDENGLDLTDEAAATQGKRMKFLSLARA